MADPRQRLQELRERARLEQLRAKSQPQNSAPQPQGSAPQPPQSQPFQVANNIDTATLEKTGKTPLQNYQESQLSIADKLAPAFGSFTKGLVESGSLGNVKVPNKNNLPESPSSEMGGRVAASIAQAGPISKVMGMLPGAGNAIGRIAASSGIGAAIGGLKAPEDNEDRASNASQGALTGLGTGVAGEGLNALLGAGKSLYRALKPGSVEEQRSALGELLQGKSAQIDPSKLKVDPEALKGLQGIRNERALSGAPSPGAAEGEIEAPLSWVDKVRSGLDKQAHSPSTGLPLPKSEEEYAAANYLRDKLHSASPEIDQAYAELSNNIRSKDYLNDAKTALFKEGKPTKALTKGIAGVGGAATRGALQGAGKYGSNAIDALLTLIGTK
jgi:hypothetical protein